MSHRRAALYLQIPAAYCRAFGGLRWAQYGEAVEFLDGPDAGRTFAFAAEIGQFLEGLLVPGRPCPAFGSALHLLYLIGLGRRAEGRSPSPRLDRLARGFRELGSPLRNAGALCAWLYGDMPGVADPPELPALLELLNGGSWIPQMVLSHPMLGAMDYAEQPPIGVDALDERMSVRLRAMTDDELRHWLKFGRGPLVPGHDLPAAAPPARVGRLAGGPGGEAPALGGDPAGRAAGGRAEPAAPSHRARRAEVRRLLGPDDPRVARADPADAVRARRRGVPPPLRRARAALFPPRDAQPPRGPRAGAPAGSGGAHLGRRPARAGRRRDGPGTPGARAASSTYGWPPPATRAAPVGLDSPALGDAARIERPVPQPGPDAGPPAAGRPRLGSRRRPLDPPAQPGRARGRRGGVPARRRRSDPALRRRGRLRGRGRALRAEARAARPAQPMPGRLGRPDGPRKTRPGAGAGRMSRRMAGRCRAHPVPLPLQDPRVDRHARATPGRDSSISTRPASESS